MPVYKIIYSDRKTLALQVDKNGELIVRAPLKTDKRIIEKFIKEHSAWIEKTQARVIKSREKYKTADEAELRKKAAEIIPLKVQHYAPLVGVSPAGVKINAAKTRFGSCSAKKMLNFSCYLMLCPDEAVDYVVVHELCHILQMNHSAAFYKEVMRVLPDYKNREKLLKL